ncbi:hypothetical protein SPRG_03151 [Saprolegnia parasitica CBS 223.65]|uniref:Uncharacterized protein n=1 Tax=Saprolegnia parasitica (strain CBS 223.65) TaxID=695850 RepID=A0A067CRQ1_SAPPC|nr:hypothetical protein SPRG_03151 [Saprolegnia parasitica CBS 223.65]KDO31935.1 hypothetical protein SPRG_03151 [Saprolegnia parasitica CBS 223.65]|eukprot:XP_012197134.1 hypothetical protein SPRG_03151 [Saprolegnia parasitica CBS 223.65]
MEGCRLVEHVAARRRLSPWMRELVQLLASGDVAVDVLLRTVDVELATNVPLVPSTASSPVFPALQELLFASMGHRWAPNLVWAGLLWPLKTTTLAPRKDLHMLIHVHGCSVLIPLLLSVLGALRVSSAPPTADDLHVLLETRANARRLPWAAICAALPRSRKVQDQYRASYVAACHRTLHRSPTAPLRYRFVGFDVDGTLVRYRTDRILRDSFAAMARRLLLVYPALQDVRPPTWRPALAQRSVAIDIDAGHFFLLGDDSNTILRAFHGSRELVDGVATLPCSALLYMHTLQDVVFAPLFAWLVDAVDSGNLPTTPGTYASLASSVRLVAYQYNAQELEPALVATPAQYIFAAKATAAVLTQLAKRYTLFILTNGTWDHANHVLTCALGAGWEGNFEFVLTEARKETFFARQVPTRPFHQLRPNGTRCLAPSPLPLTGRYCGGDASSLHAALRVAPDQVCYVGDHPVQDVELPRECVGWDTIALLEELQRGASAMAVALSPPP